MRGEAARTRDVRIGVRLEVLTVGWMIVEAVVAIGSGVVAGSTLLVAFGLDSVIELISGATVLWRLATEAGGGNDERVEVAERRSAWVVAISLALLCVYVLATAIYGLVTRTKPDPSAPGIGIALAAALIMPPLAISKRRIAARIASDALHGDAVEGITCAYMAGTVLIGLAANALVGWWWAEYVAALAFLGWLLRETREAFEEAREGEEEIRA